MKEGNDVEGFVLILLSVIQIRPRATTDHAKHVGEERLHECGCLVSLFDAEKRRSFDSYVLVLCFQHVPSSTSCLALSG